MAKKLSDLRVVELRRELEDRDLETGGLKAALVERLRDALNIEGKDPDTYEFADEMSALSSKMSTEISTISTGMLTISTEVSTISTEMSCMKVDIKSEMSSMKDDVNTKMSAVEERISTEMSTMKDEIKDDVNIKMSAVEEKISTEMSAVRDEMKADMTTIKDDVSSVENKIKLLEKKIEEIESGNKIISEEPNNEHQSAETKTDEVKSNCIEIKPKLEGSGHSRVKPPSFDGKMSWTNYLKQFEVASRANEWGEEDKAINLTIALRGDAMDVLQTLSEEESNNFEQLKKRLNMRYGQEHLEYVYQSQLKNRRQKRDETLQEYEVDIARLVRFAYPSAPENLMESLAVQTFLDGLRDHEMQRTLRLARHKTLVDVLAAALEYEAATQASGGHSKVRAVTDNDGEESQLNHIVNFIKGLTDKKTKTIRCWNCGEIGHVRSACKRPRTTDQQTNEQEN